MVSACTLHDDLLNYIAQWLDSGDIIAFKDSCQTFRKFVGLHRNNVAVSTVLLNHIIGFDASGSSKQRSVLELFVTVGHGAETSQKSEIQLGRSATYCPATKFWNFVCPRQQIHLEGGNSLVPLSMSDSQGLFLDNLLVPFRGLQELKIRSRDMERIFGPVNARNVVLACERSTERLTYAIYRQRRSQRLELLRFANQSPGTISNVSLLSRKDFEAVVHRKLVYVESRVETRSDETDRKTES
mmetsp:Transcript_3864/g.5918  ORF Transcript_3864/g.5918 Transcript_3864/m.5918 type:complete len:242 (+) Transcript_3864:73-798(+)